jgi:rubrerythrin
MKKVLTSFKRFNRLGARGKISTKGENEMSNEIEGTKRVRVNAIFIRDRAMTVCGKCFSIFGNVDSAECPVCGTENDFSVVIEMSENDCFVQV